VPALILAVAGAVVAASFGYQLVAGAAAAVVVLALASATLVHHRRTRAVEDTAWWR
jgi:hypothetical protein